MTADTAPVETMSSNRRRLLDWLNRLFLLTAVVLLGLFISQHWPQLQQMLLTARKGLLLLGWALCAICGVGQVALIILMMRAFGVQAPFLPTLRAIVLASLGKYIPGKVWVLTMRTTLLARHGVSARTILVAAASEHAFLASTALLLLGLGWTVAWPVRLGMVSLAVVVLSLLLLRWQAMSSLMSAVLARFHVRVTFPPMSRAHGLAVAVGFVVNWFALGIAIVCVGRGLNLALDWGDAAALGGSYGIAVVAGFAALVAPSGLGVREGVFASIASASISLTNALFLALAMRLLTVIAEASIVLAVVFLHALVGSTGKGNASLRGE